MAKLPCNYSGTYQFILLFYEMLQIKTVNAKTFYANHSFLPSVGKKCTFSTRLICITALPLFPHMGPTDTTKGIGEMSTSLPMF